MANGGMGRGKTPSDNSKGWNVGQNTLVLVKKDNIKLN